MTAEKKAHDFSEHQAIFDEACGEVQRLKKATKPKFELAKYNDNITYHASYKACEFIGYGMGATRGKSIYQKGYPTKDGERLEHHWDFGQRCAKELGPRFRVERVSYKGRNPKVVGRWDFDTSDIVGSTLAEPPDTLFGGVFGMDQSSATNWVKHTTKKAQRVLAAIKDEE